MNNMVGIHVVRKYDSNAQHIYHDESSDKVVYKNVLQDPQQVSVLRARLVPMGKSSHSASRRLL